jgi:hypothetical protein
VLEGRKNGVEWENHLLGNWSPIIRTVVRSAQGPAGPAAAVVTKYPVMGYLPKARGVTVEDEDLLPSVGEVWLKAISLIT